MLCCAEGCPDSPSKQQEQHVVVDLRVRQPAQKRCTKHNPEHSKDSSGRSAGSCQIMVPYSLTQRQPSRADDIVRQMGWSSMASACCRDVLPPAAPMQTAHYAVATCPPVRASVPIHQATRPPAATSPVAVFIHSSQQVAQQARHVLTPRQLGPARVCGCLKVVNHDLQHAHMSRTHVKGKKKRKEKKK